jgi:hypothetical protein
MTTDPKGGAPATLPTHLPARYRRGVLWSLDKRSEIAREVTADLIELSQDIGGWDSLSTQQRILCERIVFLRRQALAFESAVMASKPLPFEHGAYSNIANVLAGYLKALGLKRQSRSAGTLRDVWKAAETVPDSEAHATYDAMLETDKAPEQLA